MEQAHIHGLMGQAILEVFLTTGELIKQFNSMCMTIITVLLFIPEWKEKVNSLILQAEFGLVHLMERQLQV